MSEQARKRLYLYLTPPDAGRGEGDVKRLGPFRVLSFRTDGIWGSESLFAPQHIASVNDAGRYVLTDGGGEYDSANVRSPDRRLQ